MKFPVRPIRNRWPAWLERRWKRQFYVDPAVLVEDDVDPDLYRRAMFGLFLGGTIKITWSGRHREIDQILVNNVDLERGVIVDMGASDGSTSLDLVHTLGRFSAFYITDLHTELRWCRTAHSIVFFNPEGECVLVGGRRLVAWPHLSRLVGLLSRRTVAAARKVPTQPVLLLNPDVRRLLDTDLRVSFRRHDVFTVWDGPPADVVKVANLLRRLYFSDAQLLRALDAVHRSLRPEGYLVLADDSRVPGESSAGGVYRRTDVGFTRVATTERHPEIDDLVQVLRVQQAV